MTERDTCHVELSDRQTLSDALPTRGAGKAARLRQCAIPLFRFSPVNPRSVASRDLCHCWATPNGAGIVGRRPTMPQKSKRLDCRRVSP